MGVGVSLSGSKDYFILLDFKKAILILRRRGLPHPDQIVRNGWFLPALKYKKDKKKDEYD
jgi:hypothetical protein